MIFFTMADTKDTGLKNILLLDSFKQILNGIQFLMPKCGRSHNCNSLKVQNKTHFLKRKRTKKSSFSAWLRLSFWFLLSGCWSHSQLIYFAYPSASFQLKNKTPDCSWIFTE